MKPLDTSTLGPIRLIQPAPIAVDKAREMLASAIEAQGPAWKNTADNVRSGFESVWITPALSVIARLIEQLPDDAE